MSHDAWYEEYLLALEEEEGIPYLDAEPPPAGDAPVITFPTEALLSRVFMARDPDYSLDYRLWDWIELTDRVRWQYGITVSFGRNERDDVPNAGEASFVVGNQDGALSRSYPLSENYGLLSRHNPVWIMNNCGDGWFDRYFGWTSDLPKTINKFDSLLSITCKDALDHLLQSQAVKSAVYRTVTGANNPFPPLAYYPLEEGANATSFANAASPGQSASFITWSGATPQIGNDSTIPGGQAVLSVPPTTNMFITIPSYSDTAKHVNLVAMKIPAETSVAAVMGSLWLFTTTCVIEIELRVSQMEVTVWNTAITSVIFSNSDAYSETITDTWVTLFVSSEDTGGGDILNIQVLNQQGTVIAQTLDVNGGAYGRMVQAQIGNASNADQGNVGFGHYTLITDAADYDPDSDNVPFAKAVGAWAGEQMHVRGARIAAEEGFTWFCQADTSEELGPQQAAKAVDLLRDGAKADQGILYAREFGLAYRALNEMYNQPVKLALDAAQSHVPPDLRSADNTQTFYNQWTVRRPDGSFATEQVQGGVPSGDPVFAGDDTFHLSSDDQLADLASFLANRDAAEPEHWPNVPINLAKSTALIPLWRQMVQGDRFTMTGLTAYAGVMSQDLIMLGGSERWTSRTWDATLNSADGTFLQVGTLDSEYRLDTSSSVIRNDFDADDTYFEVYTGDLGDIWTTSAAHPEDFPVDITTGGEAMTATAIAGATEDRFTRTTSNGWGTNDTGQAWSITSGSAGDYATTGTVGTITLPTGDTDTRQIALATVDYSDFTLTATAVLSATATAQAIGTQIVFRYRDSSSYYMLELSYDVSGNVDVFLYVVIGGAVTTLASAANYVTYTPASETFVRIDAYGSSIKIKIWTGADEPLTYAIDVTDTSFHTGSLACGAHLAVGNTNVNPVVSIDDFFIVNPQGFTVTRAINGIVKAHKAGMNDTISGVHPLYRLRLVS